jgi:hypothetical protein
LNTCRITSGFPRASYSRRGEVGPFPDFGISGARILPEET